MTSVLEARSLAKTYDTGGAKVFGALPVIAGVTSLPARVATRIPSAQALRYE